MKRIAITSGDPSGVGPELIARLIPAFNKETAYFLYGDPEVFKKAFSLIGVKEEIIILSNPLETTVPGTYIVEIRGKGNLYVPSLQSGKLAVSSLARAVADAVAGSVDGILTMPINKYWARKVGFSYPGQTEYIARATNTHDFCMFMYSERIKVILLTTHLALKEAIPMIKKERIERMARLAHREFRKLFRKEPKIGVLGLNPHAGERGQFGTEEKNEIEPAIKTLQREGIQAEGPLSPDTAFLEPEVYDLFLCLYHDQGLIPFKIYSFYEGVNMTLGLPFPRTSPDHGTAHDIAWTGKADPRSAIKALELIEKVVNNLKE